MILYKKENDIKNYAYVYAVSHYCNFLHVFSRMLIFSCTRTKYNKCIIIRMLVLCMLKLVPTQSEMLYSN